MAVKAMFWIKYPLPESDRTYRLILDIWSEANSATVTNDEYFASGTTATEVDRSLTAFVVAYIQREWGVSFAPVIDTTRCINPVSTTNVTPSVEPPL